MRKRIYEIIEVSKDGDKVSLAYDVLMMVCIVASLIPLTLRQSYPIFAVTDVITAFLFIVDYLLRLITADFKMGKKSVSSFVRYPFTPGAIIDLVSILPSLIIINSGFKILRIFRLVRTLRVFRIFKAYRYSRSLSMVSRVIRNSKDALMAVCTLAIGYICVSALVVFNIERTTFGSFFDALYWATISLTTVGYGDIYPVTTAGRFISMVSSVFGIAIIALPSGIITAGYMDELKKIREDEDEAE
ncbi:MAG: ion transporter [Lachnospiraceae bacterium]|nr:ion transporter [Lachnospiraceae bacterium]